MQGVYTASASISGVSSARTLMYLTAPSDMVIEILEVLVTNASVDASEQLEFSTTTITSLGSPTATAVTPAAHETGSVAASSTTKSNVTSSEPTYAAVAADLQGVSSLAGYQFLPTPEGRLYVSPSASVGVQLLNTPATAFDCRVQIRFREIGG